MMNRRQHQLSGAVLLVMLIIVTIELSTQDDDVKDGCGPNEYMPKGQYTPCWHVYWEGGKKHETIPSQFIYII